MRAGAIIAAAGRGTRLGSGEPKALVPLGGLPLVVWATLPFQRSPFVEEIVVVAVEEALEAVRTWIQRCDLGKVHAVVAGGRERQDSVGRGLAALQSSEVVLVHDGVPSWRRSSSSGSPGPRRSTEPRSLRFRFGIRSNA